MCSTTGCAFANTLFQFSANDTRVLWLWNQDKHAAGFPLDPSSGPTSLCNFGYGGQWSVADLNDILVEEVDGQAPAYARAGLQGLRRSAAHGPHVMDLLCGKREPGDLINDADVVFIQFPQKAIADPSGRWLARYALDGLHYIIECAGPGTGCIAVNLSWGPQTGPHDGSSVLERAIDELVSNNRRRPLPHRCTAGGQFVRIASACTGSLRGGWQTELGRTAGWPYPGVLRGMVAKWRLAIPSISPTYSAERDERANRSEQTLDRIEVVRKVEDGRLFDDGRLWCTRLSTRTPSGADNMACGLSSLPREHQAPPG